MSGLGEFSMLELFRLEAEMQVEQLNAGFLALERQATPEVLESMMRAAHSLKGAARIVGVRSAERVAHVLEDCLVAAQEGHLVLDPARVDRLLEGVDFINRIGQLTDGTVESWEASCSDELDRLVERLNSVLANGEGQPAAPPASASDKHAPSSTDPVLVPAGAATPVQPPREAAGPRTLRLAADRLDALLRLAGEAQVAATWLTDYTSSLLRLKSRQAELTAKLSELAETLTESQAGSLAMSRLQSAQSLAAECSGTLMERVGTLSAYDRRIFNLSGRLSAEVVASRMRPFSDLAQGFPRLARDLARTLGKDFELEITGQETLVDRDILERLESPLNHLVRNAVDHGVELPEVRAAAGKPPTARVQLRADHRGGMLRIVVEDDGAGMDYDRLRETVVERGLGSKEIAARLTRDELSQFLFLPSFTSKAVPDEISGRGVGLDLVRSSIVDLGGQILVDSTPGAGMRFSLILPLTLSVVHCLLVKVDGEPYAFPLSRLDSVSQVSGEDIGELEGRPYLTSSRVPLVWLRQVLELDGEATPSATLPVVSITHNRKTFALAVEAFVGEQNLVVHRIDPRLGKLPNVASAAILEDGWPVLILDVDDLARNTERLLESRPGESLAATRRATAPLSGGPSKRVLLVEDSITVREVERQILEGMGFEVDVAVDGADGWNAVRQRDYHLIISDIDMPRMNGFELVALIKADPRLRAVPVMIVSYKDREEDRRQGMEAGADYFLTKGSFHDQTLIEVVRELTG